MLVDVNLHHNPDPILAILSDGTQPVKLADGVFQIGHFNGHLCLEGGKASWEKYPELESVGSYGVCDSWEQLLEKAPEIRDDTERKFVVFLTPVVKADQPSDGGWRWHKWGEYIGTHEIQCEYLYHEEGIEKVYCFHIYEQK